MPDEQLDIFGGAVPFEQVAAPPTPHARASDPATSHAAAATAETTFLQHRLDTLRLYAGYGMTDDEACLKSADLTVDGQPWHLGTTSKRRKRMQDRGFIEPRVELTGKTLTRPTRTGERATVWCLTTKGYELMIRWLNEQGTA